MWETWVRSVDCKDSLEKGKATHSSVLAWRTPWSQKELDTTQQLSLHSHTVKSFSVVSEAEVDVFLELSCFFYDPTDVGNLISGSSVFSKSSLNIWKFSVHILLKPSLTLISHSSKVIFKILQARKYMNRELPDVQAGFRKGRGTRNQIANIHWIIKKKTREFQKNIYFCFIDYAKAFDYVDHNKLENSERDGNTRPSDLPLEKSVCRSGSNS